MNLCIEQSLLIGPLLILRIDLLLLIKTLLVLLLCVLLCLLRLEQSAIERPSIQANKINILISHRFLISQHLLQDLTLIDQLQRHCLFLIEFSIRFYKVVKHLRYLLSDKGNRPLENIHEVRKEVRMLVLEELLDVQGVVLSKDGVTLNLMTAPLLL